MKKMKKFASVLLALVMAFALAVPALASGTSKTYSITINNKIEGYTYDAYQIFTGILDESEDILSNVEWGSGVNTSKLEDVFGKTVTLTKAAGEDEEEAKTETITLATAADYADALAKGAWTADEFASLISQCLTNTKAGSVSEATNDAYVIGNLSAGYYLVENSAVPDVDDGATDTVYTRYILQLLQNTTIEPKSSVPSVDKKIVKVDEDDDNIISDDDKTSEASIGDTVKYEITGKLPTTLYDYKTYYYEFNDVLSKGLTYNKDVNITVNGVDVTKYFYVGATEYDKTNGTTITISIEDLLALNNLDTFNDNKLKAPTAGIDTYDGSVITVTYTATLNEDAVIGGTEGNPNVVNLIYSNDPNHSGTGTTEPPEENPKKPDRPEIYGETPESKVTTFTTELTITKVDGSGNILTGAGFTLTGTGVNIVLVSKTEFVKVDEGTTGEYYKLKDDTYTKEAPVYPDIKEDGSGTEGNIDDYESLTPEYNKVTVFEAKGTGKTEAVVSGMVNENGIVTFQGLGAGIYTLEESTTPDGYNTMEPIKFAITFNANEKTFAVVDVIHNDEGEDIAGTENKTNIDLGTEANKLVTTITNNKGAELPETGGIGTTIFYVVGGVLVAGAAVLLITKKRMGSSD